MQHLQITRHTGCGDWPLIKDREQLDAFPSWPIRVWRWAFGKFKRGLFQPHWDLFAVLLFLIEGSFERSANQVCDQKVIIYLRQGLANCAREWVALQKLWACRFLLSSLKLLFTPPVCLLSFHFQILRVVKGWEHLGFIILWSCIISLLLSYLWELGSPRYRYFFYMYLYVVRFTCIFLPGLPSFTPVERVKEISACLACFVCTRHHCASVNTALWAGSPRYISFYLSPLPLTCSVVISPRASLDRDNAPAVGRQTFISFISTEMGIYQMPLLLLIVMEHVER